jgi:hypothetical protein
VESLEPAVVVPRDLLKVCEKEKRRPQISPLRFAPVEMTILLEGEFRISTKGPRNCRSLGFAPPDFLWNLVALTDLMRLSLRERRTRDLVQCCLAGNPGRDDKGEGDDSMESVAGPNALFMTLGGPQAHDYSS